MEVFVGESRRSLCFLVFLLVGSMTDRVVEAVQTAGASVCRMEQSIHHFIDGQQRVQEHMDHLFARVHQGEDHLKLRVDRLNAKVSAILNVLGSLPLSRSQSSLDYVPPDSPPGFCCP